MKALTAVLSHHPSRQDLPVGSLPPWSAVLHCPAAGARSPILAFLPHAAPLWSFLLVSASLLKFPLVFPHIGSVQGSVPAQGWHPQVPGGVS